MFDPKENIEDELVNKTEDMITITSSETENSSLIVGYQEDDWDNICGDIVNFK